MNRNASLTALAALTCLLAACGGHGDSPPAEAPAPSPIPAPAVAGISTPSSVSVVTAKNAN